MHGRMAQLSLFLVAFLIGILLVGQLRSQARPVALNTLSADELAALVDQLSSRNDDLRDGLRALRSQVREYERAQELGQSGREQTEQTRLRVRGFAGLLPVRGQGIHMEVAGELDEIAVNDLINELRNAGAEAIAVDDIRITAQSVCVRGAGALEIDGVAIGSTFTMDAIGPPEGLLATMDRPGGIAARLEQSVLAVIDIEQVEDILIPATRRDLMPQLARPVE
jgi:uncharacterized protein YlxW (UPF0749 family)